jgi:hypothetical protein
MLFFLLPRLNPNLYTHIDVSTSDRIPKPCISHSLSFFLTDIKTNIQLRKQMEYIQAVRQPIRVYPLRRPE